MTDTPAQSEPKAAPAHHSAEDAPVPKHREATFMKKVDGLLKGSTKAWHQASGPVVEDLRAVAAEQDELRKQLQKVSETAQQVQSSLIQAQGKADALLQVLQRLEAQQP